MKNDQEDINEDQYMLGFQNKLIRYWYYLENGLNIINEFRNLFLGIIGIYIALKLDNVLWLFAMFIPMIIILTIVGYYAVHRVAKVKEWVSLKFSTHYGIRNFDYTKGTYEELVKLNEKLSPPSSH